MCDCQVLRPGVQQEIISGSREAAERVAATVASRLVSETKMVDENMVSRGPGCWGC